MDSHCPLSPTNHRALDHYKNLTLLPICEVQIELPALTKILESGCEENHDG